MTDAATVDLLAKELADRVSSSGLPLSVAASRTFGFGLTGAEMLTVRIGDGIPLTVVHEGGGDYWLEMVDRFTAVWWRQGRLSANLSDVIVAIAEGRFEVIDDRVRVSPLDRRALWLQSRM